MKLTVACLLSMLLVGFSSAADLTGHWSGLAQMTGPDGTQYQVGGYLDLKQEGTKVSGVGGTDQGESLPLEDVQFDGKILTFKVTGPDARIYKGNLELISPDQLEGKLEFTTEDGTAVTAKFALKREPPKQQ